MPEFDDTIYTSKDVLATNAEFDKVDSSKRSLFRDGLEIGIPIVDDIGIGLTAYKDGSIITSGIVTAAQFVGDGSALTNVTAAATGGGSDEVFYENDQTVTTDYTLTAGKNAMSAGPITINSSVTITVPAGAAWTVV